MKNITKISKIASDILQDSKKDYQRLLKKEIAQQKGKKNVCKAAKAASQKYKKMTWSEALKKAAKSGPRQTKLKI